MLIRVMLCFLGKVEGISRGIAVSTRKKQRVHCKVIIGRNPIEANANTVAIQLPGNPVAYIGKCFTPY